MNQGPESNEGSDMVLVLFIYKFLEVTSFPNGTVVDRDTIQRLIPVFICRHVNIKVTKE